MSPCGFETVPGTLVDAAVNALDIATAVAELRDAAAAETDKATESLAAVSAGPEYEAFRDELRAALERLTASQTTWALNTEAAAVRYEDADLRSMRGEAPPVPPSPEDLEKAREEAEKLSPPWLGLPPEDRIV